MKSGRKRRPLSHSHDKQAASKNPRPSSIIPPPAAVGRHQTSSWTASVSRSTTHRSYRPPMITPAPPCICFEVHCSHLLLATRVRAALRKQEVRCGIVLHDGTASRPGPSPTLFDPASVIFHVSYRRDFDAFICQPSPPH